MQRPSFTNAGTKVTRSTSAVSGIIIHRGRRQSMRRRGRGPRGMHHREQIPFSSLYFHGGEAGRRQERERERERERAEEDRDRAVPPDLHVAAVSPLNSRSINIRWLNPRNLPPPSLFLSRSGSFLFLPDLLPRPLPPAAPNELIARAAKEKTRESGTKWPLRNVRPFVCPVVRFNGKGGRAGWW